MRSIATALFAAVASRRGRGGKNRTATLEVPRASIYGVERLDLTLRAPNTHPPLTLETIELDDLVTVPDVVW